MKFYRVLAIVIVVAVAATACDNSGSTTTTPTTPTTVTEVFPGTVNPGQSSSTNFSVGQGGGTITATLTSAIETLPGGALLTTVTMGVFVGQPSGSTCVILSGESAALVTGGPTPAISGSVAQGTYCLQVYDVSGQLGPVAYAVAVNHP